MTHNGGGMTPCEKVAKKGGTPFLGDFWPFWAKLAPKGRSLGHPVGCKVLEKRASHLYGARSEAIRRVYLGTRGTVHPKYTFWMASDLTPYGWDTLVPYTPLSAPGIHRLGPLFFFRRFHLPRPRGRRFSGKKKVRFSPHLGHP